jgi:hypothetical protein
MLEPNPELELALQKYVMESILKQVFFIIKFTNFWGVRDLGQLERLKKKTPSCN